jgi:hypothetical protein
MLGSFIIFASYEISLGQSNQELSVAYCMCGGEGKCMQGFVEET